MKKLEPVLQMKKRVMHCHTIPTAVQPLNECKGDKCKQQDAYCFSSSSTEDVAEKKTRDELKKEKQVCKTRAKKILKVGIAINLTLANWELKVKLIT